MIKLLLVEDDAAQIELTREGMRHLKLLNQLDVVTSGEEALARLLKADPPARPDLILVDLNLPGMTGMELIEQLKQNEQTRELSVVVLSALEPSHEAREVLLRQGIPWVLKPLVSAKDYLAIVRAVDRLGLALVLRERS